MKYRKDIKTDGITGMSNKETFINDYFNTDQVLLDFFKEQLSESEYRAASAKIKILSESAKDVYTLSIQGHKYPISLLQFMSAYSNPKKYESNADVLIAQGVDANHIAEGTTPYNVYARQKVHELLNKFEERGLLRSPNTDYPEVPAPGSRYAYYVDDALLNSDNEAIGEKNGKKEKGKKSGKQQEFDFSYGQPSTEKDAIDHRNSKNTRSHKMAKRINSNELMAGEFYSDMSRLPKRVWKKWYQVWKREASKLPLDKGSLGDRLIGKRWKKSFILGYKLEEGLLLEIWYNSIDSSFTVHDQRGINVARKRAKTLNEALKLLSTYVSQSNTGDADVLFTQRNPLTQSVTNSLARTLDSDYIQKLQKADDDAEAKIRGEFDKQKEQSQTKSETRTKVASEVKDRVRAGAEQFNDKIRSASIGAYGSISKFADALVSEYKDHAEFVKSKGFNDGLNDIVNDVTNATDNFQNVQDELSIRLKNLNDRIQKYLSEYREMDSAASDDSEAQIKAQQLQMKVKNARSQVQLLTQLKKKAEKSNRELEEKSKEIMKDIEAYIKKLAQTDGMTDDQRREALEREMIKWVEEIEKEKARANRDAEAANKLSKEAENTNESLEITGNLINEDALDFLDGSDMSNEPTLDTSIGGAGYKRVVDSVKARAENMTLSFIKNHVMEDQIEVYYSTKAPKRSLVNPRLFSGKMKFKKNGNLRGLPNSRPVFNKLMGALKSEIYRADFIVGFQLNKGPKFEIWYVTEPAPNAVKDDMNEIDSIATFYVYDIDAEEIVKRYIPYYRNALQVVMLKIGAFNQ